MADVVSTTRRTVLAMAGAAATLTPAAAAPVDPAVQRLARLKALKAEAVVAWAARRPDTEARREAYATVARRMLDHPARSVADLGVKAWIADIGVDGGDIGLIAGQASQVLARDVRNMAGV